MLERSARADRAGAGAARKGAALLMLDIDRFKAINDTYGHAAGDRVLKEVAGRMAASCRGGDLLGRVGGEEFLAVFADVTAAEAAVIAERLREAVARTPVAIERRHGARGDGERRAARRWRRRRRRRTLSEALSRADAALYRAKAEGRNRIVPAGAARVRGAGAPACPSAARRQAARMAAARTSSETWSSYWAKFVANMATSFAAWAS